MSLQDNWFTSVDLPTYNFSLYLVSDTVFNSPDLLRNDAPLLRSGQAILIAQSGKTASFVMDNVAFTTSALQGSAETAHSTVSTINFDLHEVLGFELYEAIYQDMLRLNYPTLADAKFVIKLYFQGRAVGTGTPVKFPGTFLFQCSIQQITASLGPQGTVYNWTVNCQSRFTQDMSRQASAVTVRSIRTVQEFLTGVQSGLNQNERRLRQETPDQQVDVVHKEWEIRADASMSPLLSELMQGVQEGSSGTSGTEPGTVEFTIPPNTNVMAFLFETLNQEIPALRTMREEAEWEEGLPKVIVTSHTEIDTRQVDPQTNRITHRIIIDITLGRTFDRPPAQPPSEEQANRESLRVQNSYLNSLDPHIFKRYDYMYTGMNTEVLEVDLTINANYFASIPPSYNTQSMAGGQFVPLTSATEKTSNNATGPRPSSLPQNGAQGVQQDHSQSSSSDNNTTAGDGSANVNEQLDMITGSLNAAFMTMNLEIVGDPFWCGASDAYPTSDMVQNTSTGANRAGDVLVAFINYLPSQNVAMFENQRRGRFDYFTSGVYVVTSISSRFQAGKFTQTLSLTKREDLTSNLVKSRLERL